MIEFSEIQVCRSLCSTPEEGMLSLADLRALFPNAEPAEMKNTLRRAEQHGLLEGLTACGFVEGWTADQKALFQVTDAGRLIKERTIDEHAADLSALRSAAFPAPARLSRRLAKVIDSYLIVDFIQAHLEREMVCSVPNPRAEALVQYQAAYEVAPQDVRIAFFSLNCTLT